MKSNHHILWGLGLALLFPFFMGCQNNQPNDQELPKEPVVLSDTNRKASCVYLTNDPSGNPVMSWVEIDTTSQQKLFYFGKINPKTGLLEDKISIPIEQNASIHEEGMPKIAIKGDGTIFALFETSNPMDGMKWGLGDLRYIQSHDGGKTWTEPKSVSPDVKKGLSANFSNLTRLADGEIGITWLGTHPGHQSMAANQDMEQMHHMVMEGATGRPVYFAKTISNDSLSPEVMISESACECCRTSVIGEKDGVIKVAFRNLLPGNIRDISLSVSTDNGQSFSKPNSFSHDEWEIDGCPHDGPAIAFSAKNTFVSWFTGAAEDKGINFAFLNGNGEMENKINLTANGKFTQIAALPDGSPIIAFNQTLQQEDSIQNEIIVGKIKDNHFYGQTIDDAGAEANFPMIQAFDKERAVVAWRDGNKVLFKVVDLKKATQKLALR